MTSHKVGTREEWLADRLKLLDAEKALTRQGDELARWRRELPWVRIDKDYRFDTDEGPASLADLFRGRSQLLIYDFMFGPDYTAGCPSCSAIADGFDGSSTSSITTSRSTRSRGLRSRSCRTTSAEWAGASPGRLRSTATSTTTSTSRTQMRNGSREPSTTTCARWTFRPPRGVPCSPSSRRALERTLRRTGERGPGMSALAPGE